MAAIKKGITVVGVEAWRPIPGFPGLEASLLGRVRKGPVVLSQHTHSSRGRYLAVSASNGTRRGSFLVHQLVALAFLGSPPGPTGRGSHDWQVNHKNGERRDNRPKNLEWVQHAENHRHASVAGLLAVGEAHGLTTITEDDVVQIRTAYSAGLGSQHNLGLRYGVSQRTVSRIVRRETWRHVA